MRQLQFSATTKEGLNEYHLAATNKKWLEKTLWSDRQALYNTLLDPENGENKFHKLFYNLAYNNSTHEENIFIYERLIWDLIQDRTVYAIVNFRTARFLSDNNVSFDTVNWEYEIEHKLASDDAATTVFSDNRFIKAHTGWIQPPSPRWNNDDDDKTAFFRITDFRTFLNVVFSIAMDDYGSVNFFCVEENPASKLQGSDKPSLQQILSKNDRFITLFLGSDEGYQDYILIKSKGDLSAELNTITSQLNTAGHLYEQGLDTINSFDDLVGLIKRCFGLNALSPTSASQ